MGCLLEAPLGASSWCIMFGLIGLDIPHGLWEGLFSLTDFSVNGMRKHGAGLVSSFWVFLKNYEQDYFVFFVVKLRVL